MNDLATRLTNGTAGPAPDSLAESIAELQRMAERLGAAQERHRLRLIGELHCLSADVSEAEFLGVLARGGLCVSSVGGVTLIHRMPTL